MRSPLIVFRVSFPNSRPRRLRRTSSIRGLVAETKLGTQDLIAPLFVREGLKGPVEITSLPGVFQHSIESLVKEVDALLAVGVRAVALFGVPQKKDPLGKSGYDREGIAQTAIRALKDRFQDDLVVAADLCLDEYTDHGHCGLVRDDGEVDNDSTLELYAKMAVVQGEAGVDFVAPSGMMDGQVRAIRGALDLAGFMEVGVLAYSVKYSSSLYGPFRDAVNVVIQDGGDRKGYQQDYRNSNEAIREVMLDLEEGADVVMVKPAGMYLDIISKVKQVIDVPLAAYQVSGEYAMIKAAARNGWIDETAVALEQLYAIKRAGADMILTYFAKDLAPLL